MTSLQLHFLVIPGREPRAKLTKSILSLGERTRNPATRSDFWIPGSPPGRALRDLDDAPE
jgi:hypothetical protein